MNIGILGSSALAAVVATRLAPTHQIHVLASSGVDVAGLKQTAHSAELARTCEVVIVCAASPEEANALFHGPQGLCAGLSAGRMVIDQTHSDPDTARALATEIRKTGADYIDAPAHCEQLSAWPDTAAVLCGGSTEAMTAVRPLLDALGAKVVHAGDTGSGQTALIVVAVVAASNRLIAYECAAMGSRNGLSVADMGAVLTRCSGYCSATARVLPAIATGGQAADVTTGSVVEDLRSAANLAMKVGAPLLVGNLVGSLLQAAANESGADVGLDATFSLFTKSARIPSTS